MHREHSLRVIELVVWILSNLDFRTFFFRAGKSYPDAILSYSFDKHTLIYLPTSYLVTTFSSIAGIIVFLVTSSRDIFGSFSVPILLPVSSTPLKFPFLSLSKIVSHFWVMVRSIFFINSRIRVSWYFNHLTHSHTTNWNYRPSLFNVIVILHEGSCSNIH